jgi:hypothetical protein
MLTAAAIRKLLDDIVTLGLVNGAGSRPSGENRSLVWVLPAYDMAIVVAVIPLIDDPYAGRILPEVDCRMPGIVTVERGYRCSGPDRCVALHLHAGPPLR